jgi:CHAT domain-containing protein
MGASSFSTDQEQAELQTVETQITSILQIWSGKGLLNGDFTYNNLRRERQQQPFGIVHLATHADFQSDDSTKSYIQLENRKLYFNSDDIRALGWNKPPVQLLVLSACKTAIGSPESELGFAGLAYRTGVTSAIASLWTVSQKTTLPLMVELYHQLQQAPIKAEALRQAQLAMINGTVQIEYDQEGNGFLRLSDGTLIALQELEDQIGAPPLSDPFYWSAFTMIGSPW